MEKSYNIKQLRLIFGDGYLQESLIMSLAITETCTLRCDYYYRMENIWPKIFGQSTMYSIGKYLQCMLLSETIYRWDEAYNQAVKVLEAIQNSVLILTAIYQNPSYYAGYYLKRIKGRMDNLGSVIADQNHAVNFYYIRAIDKWV